jgi:AI-2E family transporter
METVPGEDLERLKEGLPPDSLDTGSQRLKDRPGMPPARDARTIFLGMLCLIAVLACLYVAQDIVVPVVLALVLKLLLQTLVSLLERLHVPRPAGALIALAVLLSVFVGLGTLLSSPAAQWVSQLPQTWPQLQEKFAFFKDPVEHMQRTFDQMGIRLGGPRCRALLHCLPNCDLQSPSRHCRNGCINSDQSKLDEARGGSAGRDSIHQLPGERALEHGQFASGRPNLTNINASEKARAEDSR